MRGEDRGFWVNGGWWWVWKREEDFLWGRCECWLMIRERTHEETRMGF